jgi:hypothetical protein
MEISYSLEVVRRGGDRRDEVLALLAGVQVPGGDDFGRVTSGGSLSFSVASTEDVGLKN